MVHSDSNRRREFRIRYPLAERPKLRIEQTDYEIIDISEGGIRFRAAAEAFSEGQQVSGSVGFHDGEIADVSGVLKLRSKGEAVIISLTGITFNRVMAEQRYLTQKYPGFGGQA